MQTLLTTGRRRTFALAAIVALTAVLAWLILQTSPPAATSPAEHDDHQADAETAPATAAFTSTPAAAPLQLSGEIQLDQDHTARLASRVAGWLESTPVSPGQVVRRGQVLAVISSNALADLRSEALTAQRRLELANATYLREQTLWREQISAEQDYLQARQAWREADIVLRNLRQKLAALGADAAAQDAFASDTATPRSPPIQPTPPTPPTPSRHSAPLQPSQSPSLARYLLRAPFDGVLVERTLAAGAPVRDDQAWLTVSSLDHVWLELAVPERALAQVRAGTHIAISSGTGPGSAAPVSATITLVSPVLNPASRSATARAILPNPLMDGERRWRPGMLVTVTVADGGGKP